MYQMKGYSSLVSVTFLVIFFVGIVSKLRVIKIHEID